MALFFRCSHNPLYLLHVCCTFRFIKSNNAREKTVSYKSQFCVRGIPLSSRLFSYYFSAENTWISENVSVCVDFIRMHYLNILGYYPSNIQTIPAKSDKYSSIWLQWPPANNTMYYSLFACIHTHTCVNFKFLKCYNIFQTVRNIFFIYLWYIISFIFVP